MVTHLLPLPLIHKAWDCSLATLRRGPDVPTSYVAPPLMPRGRDAPPTVLGEEGMLVTPSHDHIPVYMYTQHKHTCIHTHIIHTQHTCIILNTCVHTHTVHTHITHTHTHMQTHNTHARMQTHTTHALTHTHRMILRNLCCQFLDCCYNSIMSYVLVSFK